MFTTSFFVVLVVDVIPCGFVVGLVTDELGSLVVASGISLLHPTVYHT